MHEEFKTAYQGTDGYRRTARHFIDAEIFAMERDGSRFSRPKTQSAFEGWLLARKEPPSRQAFEAAFKETDEYECICRGPSLPGGVFSRNEAGVYYHPTIALAWKFYKLGAK